MTLFDEREHAAELMFVHDEEMRFRALARRNKLLGLWAADKMGLSGAHAEMYAHDLVALHRDYDGLGSGSGGLGAG